MKFVRDIWLALLIGLLSSISLHAQQLKTMLDTSVIQVGEQTVLSFKMSIGSNESVQAPVFDADTITENIEIVDILKTDTLASDSNFKRLIFNYRITSFDSGYHVIPPVLFITGNDSLFTEPAMLEVQTMAVDTTKAFKPIKGIKDEPLRLSDVLPWIAALAAMILLVGFIIVMIRKRKGKRILPVAPPKPALPPWEEAMKRLEELQNQKLWQKEQVKKYYIKLTAVVRHYIERRFNVDSEELTSRETLEQMQPKLSAEAYTHLKQLLEQADLVKFARLKPLPDDNDMSFKHAIAFIELSKPQQTESEEKEKNDDVE